MSSRGRQFLWLLAVVVLVVVGMRWGPALMGSDIPIDGVAWTEVVLSTEGPTKITVASLRHPAKIRAFTDFLKRRSSGWIDYPPPGLYTDHELLLTSTQSNLRIDLVLDRSGGRMFWNRRQRAIFHPLSADEVRQLLGFFGKKWSQEKHEVVSE